MKNLKQGIYELRIHYGPGYRVYFAEEGDNIILLLVGGSKKTQQKDIQKAINYWHDFQEQYHGKN